ncbi:uncharacterized protein MONOS_10597 [Monocercomonoides exilis]|uniref:uncharacterized protein n=1 Tax=Monocercomonoides exilis TaxID=2049356 RepID=UPI00355AA41C|nr:hypothetical protein MONOS_10597 [Monocercomonoides exilis]|eukprot:MONOS_10597.1-p1 / transcript=MONOS_10597.1 / gene=MONOS_10597 / organism=Monocercomonoides_exilis_PA203 / gene_product=unspecified product / transcript_product=unspecified product / location=Mono_scaffold00488:14855-15634(+) / protein_length=219 / sequence_SO=supercontig / SO=protein_coding / is_pseudo=false
MDREKLKWLQSFVGRVQSGFFGLAGARHAVIASLQPIGSEEPAIPIAERERRLIESLGKQQETHTVNDPRFPAQIPAELPLPYPARSPPLPFAQPRSDCMGSSLAGQNKTDTSLSADKDGIFGSVQIPQIPLSSNKSSCFYPSSSSSLTRPHLFTLFSSSPQFPSMLYPASLDVHLNCFPLLQLYTPLCISISNDIRVLAVQNEMNGHRMRNARGRGK